MNKNEFLNELRSTLGRLPEDERESALTYYEEFIEEAGPENEQDVISKLGTPQRVADNIFREFNTNIAVAGTPNYSNTNDVRQENTNNQGQKNQYNNSQQAYNGQYTNTQNQSYNNQYTNSQRPQKNTNVGLIILLVVCSPLILGLGGGAVGVIIGFAGALFGIAVAAIATVFALIIAGVAIIIAGISALFVSTAGGALLIGTGIAVLGFGLLLAVPTTALLISGIPALIRGISNLFKKLFGKRTGGSI